jgi:hypothetical protein
VEGDEVTELKPAGLLSAPHLRNAVDVVLAALKQKPHSKEVVHLNSSVVHENTTDAKLLRPARLTISK